MNAIDTSITAYVRALGGDELMLKAMNSGTKAFVLNYHTEILVSLRGGTVIRFSEVPSMKMSHGMKRVKTFTRQPLAEIQIDLGNKMFLRIKDTEELIALDDLGANIQAVVIALPPKREKLDISFDIGTQLIEHGVVAGVDAEMLRHDLFDV